MSGTNFSAEIKHSMQAKSKAKGKPIPGKSAPKGDNQGGSGSNNPSTSRSLPSQSHSVSKAPPSHGPSPASGKSTASVHRADDMQSPNVGGGPAMPSGGSNGSSIDQSVHGLHTPQTQQGGSGLEAAHAHVVHALMMRDRGR